MSAQLVLEPFHLPQSLFPFAESVIGRALCAACERGLALPALNRVYAHSQGADAGDFSQRVLQTLDVRVQVSDDALQTIPKTGPLVVVANHPFGGLDGLILAALLQRVRSDARVLVNFLLARIPEMRAGSFFVDPFGGAAAAARNRAAMRTAMHWVERGGALGVFPAGEVSHFTWRRGCVSDPAWSDTVARLVLRTRATVVPIYFDGHNSRLFQLLGLLHPRLRTAMLPRELLRLRGHSVRVEIGAAIPPERLARLRQESPVSAARRADAADVTEFLRLRTYILRGRSAPAIPAPRRKSHNTRRAQPIAPALPAAQLAAEVQALPGAQCLATSGTLQVFVGNGEQIPLILREIGRLREQTFRVVGEGTGRATDLDRFDEHYLHLFVWSAESQRVVGAYRMGQTDVLQARGGADGLYTNTLFRYRPSLLDQLTPGLELGRSFVIPEYQRDYAPLLLLWKGIGRYVARHPRYRLLFGAVSISDDYQSMTKQLLMAFLRAHSYDEALGALVQPRTPPRTLRFRDADERRLATLVTDMADVEELIGEIESNRRGVPVLLRQYLKLNARLLGFNVDSEFGGVVDGLVLVDLVNLERPVLNRYLGSEGAESFLAFHGARRAASSSAPGAITSS